MICGTWGPYPQQQTLNRFSGSTQQSPMSAAGYSRQPSLGFEDSGDEKQHVDTNGGDYSTRMSELFDDDDDDTPTVSAPRFDFDDDDDDEEAFVYDGADAQVTRTSYREQLREVLDDDDDDDDDTAEEHEVERSLLHDRDHPPIAVEDEALVSHSVQTRLFDAHLAWHTHLHAVLISLRPTSHLRRLPLHQHLFLHHQSCPPPYRTERLPLYR